MKITVVEEGTRSTLELDGPSVRVGRAIDNQVRLTSTLASRHHCRFEIGAEGLYVVDQGSANGTLVNGERVERRRLSPGDVVSIGGSRIHVEPDGAEAPELPAAPEPGDTQPIEPPDEGAALGVDAGSVGLQTRHGDERRRGDDLAVFAGITRALARETEFEPLLRLIVDSAVALAGGERGFLLLAGRAEGGRSTGGDGLRVRVARSFDRADVAAPATRLSQGIAERVAQSGRPLLSVDAGRDDRFAGMASVEDLRLRSVLCVPIRIEGRVEGVLYVDNRLQRGAFTEDDLDLVELFAGQAAVAIRNSRFVSELLERNERLVATQRQIERLNAELGRRVQDQEGELALVRAELERERGRYDYGSIVGASHAMRKVFRELDRIVETELPVVIHGESGTGKELIARAIHFNGSRRDGPFVVENCAALPDTLLESELFGHVRGAFTGADRSKKGLVEQATGGTLFLDEIGDMSPEMQKKLLRVLQEGEVRPLGSSKTVKVDFRLLAASNRDLAEMMSRGEFREDLYYRLNVLEVSLPSLRERREDVPLLAEHLLARAAREAGRPVPALGHEVVAVLAAHDWPGNVRELENEMRRLVVLAGDAVRLEHLSPAVVAGAGEPAAEADAAWDRSPEILGDLREAVARFERRAIEAALARNGGNKSRAGRELGISRFALQRKMEKYCVSPADGDGGEEDGDDRRDVADRAGGE